MAASFDFQEANTAGQVLTGNRLESNWKNIDDTTSVYSAFPIVAGLNSFDKYQGGHFSGAYNQLLNGLWAHTAGALGAGLTVKATKTMTADSDRMTFTTPSITTDATLTYDATAVTAIGSGKAVWFGPVAFDSPGKVASTGTNPAYTNWLTTQLQTTVSAVPGDITSCTLTLRYDEN